MSKLISPWPDFFGKPIYEGDQIRHPNGDVGTVTIDRDFKNIWRVVYPNGDNCALVLQVGEKGGAVVDQPKVAEPLLDVGAVALEYAKKIRNAQQERCYVNGEQQRVEVIRVLVEVALAKAVAIERERAARLAVQFAEERVPNSGSNALRAYANMLREGVKPEDVKS